MFYNMLHYPFRLRSSSHTWSLPFTLYPIDHLLHHTFLFPVFFSIPIPVLISHLSLAFEYHSLLLPPPLGKPRSRTPLCLQAEFQNRSCCDVLCGWILLPGGVGLHILQTDCPHSFPQGRVV